MKKLICIAIAIIMVNGVYSQRSDGSIKGTLIDTSLHKPVFDATISLLRISDSALIAYTISNKQGAFEFKNINQGRYYFFVSHQEFIEIKKIIEISSSNKRIDFSEILMSHDLKTLGEVIITSEAPVVIKNDTIQFNASRFKTKANATAEDLLKKMPGIEIDKNGNVKTMGEQVQKIYVDGREFFGKDPKLATRNLTADMIESVQVFDDMSDQAKFTKIDDGSRSKTINLKLKKDKKNGVFGRVQGGYGDHGRYEGNSSLNKFHDKERASLLFNINNIGQAGFAPSAGGVRGGGSSPGNAGSSGLTRSIFTGANYSNIWAPQWDLGSNYTYTNINNKQEQDILRRSTFGDSIATLNRNRNSEATNQSHQFNIRLDYKMDSVTTISYSPSFYLSRSSNFNEDTSFTFAEKGNAKYQAINGRTANSNLSDGISLNNSFSIRRRFGKIGRTLSVSWNNSISNNDGKGYTLSHNSFFNENGSIFQSLQQDQFNKQNSKSNNNTWSTSYTEPIGVNKLFEINYAYTNNQSQSDRKTYDFNSQTGNYDNINQQLTNEFENTFLSHRIGANFRAQRPQYNYQLGFAGQQTTLESRTIQSLSSKDSTVRTNYLNFFPTANMNITLGRSKTIRLSYNGRTNPPTVTQLQNVLNVTDPLNVSVGNPNLKQEFSHNWNLGYSTFNPQTSRFISLNASFSTTNNKIVNSLDTLSRGVQLIRPENVNGNYYANTYITFGVPFKKPELKGSTVNLSNNISYYRNIALLYKHRNINRTVTVEQNMNVYLITEKFDLDLSAKFIYNGVNYSIDKSLNEDYLTQWYSGGFAYTFKGDIILGTDFSYFINSGRAEGYNQSIPLWNASISKQFFKKKRAEFKFSIRDILNQNESIARVAADNYIQDTRSNVLRRFILVSFRYAFNNMGKKSSN